MTDSSMLPPAAWYADPQDPAGLRYWDGAQWTDQTRPMVAEPVAPEPVAELVTPEPVAPEPITHEPVAAQPSAPQAVAVEPVTQMRVTETAVDEPVAFEAAPVAVEATTVAPAQELYPGFAAEVAALQEHSEAADSATAAPADAVVVVTGETCAGHRIVSAVGTAVGTAVVSASDLMGRFPAAAGDPAATLQKARKDALAAVAAEAAAMGATAVVGLHLKTRSAGELTEIFAFGTAVVTEKE